MIYNRNSKLSEPIFSDPSIVAVMGRFGIFPGVGDITIKEICEGKEINEEFFLAIINTYLNPDYFPALSPDRENLSRVLTYLDKTIAYYKHVQLPNIDRHFNLLLNSSNISTDTNGNLKLLNQFYQEVKSEIEALSPTSPRSIVLEDKIRDLLSFFVIHLKGEYDRNLCLAVLSAIFILEKDVLQTNRIRERIYEPFCECSSESTIQEVLENVRTGLKTHPMPAHAGKLSPREVEVLRELAKGMTQKEIAEKLCISITTVITHRKNISEKLGIRSISGLALYAAMNGIL